MVRGVLTILLGLILAVLVAVAAGSFAGLPLLGAKTGAGFEPPLARLVNGSWPVLLFSMPLALAAIAAAEAQRWRSWVHWGLVGSLIGLFGYASFKMMGDAVTPSMTGGLAPVTFAVMGLLGGITYWLVAGRNTGDLAAVVRAPHNSGQPSEKSERRRCALCAAAGLLLGLIPLALLGWYSFHRSNPPLAKTIAAKAVSDADGKLKDAGLPSLRFSIDERLHHEHIGHVSGSVADYSERIKAFDKAKSVLAPMIGMPGVVAVLQNDILARDEADPAVAAENARIRAAQEAARSLAEEAAALRKAEQARLAVAEAEAKRKADEEAAAKKKAEDEARLAAEVEAKRKADEDAAAKKKAEDEARLAAEVEAKRKADEQSAQNPSVQQTGGNGEDREEWVPGRGMDAMTITRVNCVSEFGQLFASEPVRFALKSASLESHHASFLDKLGNVAKKCDGIGILIEGNSDPWGAEDFNQALSEQRAEAVRAALVERGVSAKQLATRGFGELKPLIRERSRAADAANRRVDFGVIEIEKIPQTILPKDAEPAKN